MPEVRERTHSWLRDAIASQLRQAASWTYDAKHLAFLYALLIPGMAVVYTRLPPSSFYDGNLHLEREVETDRQTLAARLLADYRNSTAASTNPDSRHLRYALPQTVKVSLPRVQDGEIVATFSGDYINPPASDGGPPAFQAMPRGSGSFWVTYEIRPQFGPSGLEQRPAWSADIDETAERWASDISPRPADGGYPDPTGGSVRQRPCPNDRCQGGDFRDLIFPVQTGRPAVSSKTAALARRSIGAADGDPTQASHRFTRMLYLSSVVITTVGFGDITPISREARLLVGGEAVAGVLIAGLFLAALAEALADELKRQT